MDTPEIPILETERLRLRAFRRSDFEDYATLYGDPEVLRYLGGGAATWDRARCWRQLAFLLGHWQLGGCGMWAVALRETGALVGSIGFAHPEGWPGFELAWVLARRWWGRGYATEGARAALAHAFDVLHKDRVISLIDPENVASVRVAERIGERLLGRTRYALGERLCYGIDREQYAVRDDVHFQPWGLENPERAGTARCASVSYSA
jgi:RimJ/RimL family protein N-acetyltransferase